MDSSLVALVAHLERISPMPDDDSPELTPDRLREYEEVIRQIEQAVTQSNEWDPALLAPLLASFGYGDAFGLYWATLHLLEDFPPDVLRPALRQALMSGQPGTRRWATYMLGVQRDRRDVPVVVKALQDEADEVRYYALMALRMIGDPSALPAMESLLQDPMASVRKAAQKYVEELRALNSLEATAE